MYDLKASHNNSTIDNSRNDTVVELGFWDKAKKAQHAQDEKIERRRAAMKSI